MDTLAVMPEFFVIAAVFGLLLWVSVFLATYMHFPKMEPKKRIELSIVNASTVFAALLVLSIIFFLILNLYLK